MTNKVQAAFDKIFGTAKADIDTLLADIGVAKAADAMAEGDKVNDQWQAGQKHGAATAQEVNVGPAQAANGSNPERMNSQYSSNAPQSGTQADAEKLLSNLSILEATAKAHGSMLAHQGTAITALIETTKGIHTLLSGLVTAKAEDDDKDEYAEKAKARATVFLADATSLLAKAKALIKALEDMDDDDDKEAAKANKSAARKARKEASIALGKAQRFAYIAGDSELKKSVLELAVKADVEIADDDAMEKAADDEGAAAKAAKAAPAATEKGMQADRQDPATGNQAAATAKALSDALTGLATLQTTVHGLVDLVSGQSQRPAVTVVKAAVVEPDESIYDRIEKAQDHNMLTSGEAIQATSIAQAYDAVKKGTLDKGTWQSRLEKAPAAVRALYANLAA